MSRTPENKNIPQKLLYKIGERRMGKELASVSPDHLVRKRGGMLVGKAALAGLGLIGAVEFTGHAIDRSPTVVQYQEQHPHGETQAIHIDHSEDAPMNITVHTTKKP